MAEKKNYFQIDRADDCIWLTDLREEKSKPIHFVPSQAEEVGKRLQEIAK